MVVKRLSRRNRALCRRNRTVVPCGSIEELPMCVKCGPFSRIETVGCMNDYGIPLMGDNGRGTEWSDPGRSEEVSESDLRPSTVDTNDSPFVELTHHQSQTCFMREDLHRQDWHLSK
jgi:hypothetical protein